MKKIVIVLVFIFTIISLNACRSTSRCSYVENQELNNNKIHVTSSLEVAT